MEEDTDETDNLTYIPFEEFQKLYKFAKKKALTLSKSFRKLIYMPKLSPWIFLD